MDRSFRRVTNERRNHFLEPGSHLPTGFIIRRVIREDDAYVHESVVVVIELAGFDQQTFRQSVVIVSEREK